MEPHPLFTTLGMLVLDAIHLPNQPPRTDIIGGSGAWCILGARLFLAPPLSHQLGWLIRTGSDFPSSVRALLQSWDIQLHETAVTGQRSTRGELVYADTTFGPKKFRYTTSPLNIQPIHFLSSVPLLATPFLHLLSSPNDTKSQIQDLLNLRRSSGIGEQPTIIWEPAPPSCVPENLASFLEAMKMIDIFSPNHIELAALFSINLRSEDEFDHSTIEHLASKCLESGIGPRGQGTVIIRAGQEGCYVYSRQRGEFIWLPPYYVHNNSSQVIDPTGAGNAFLGGFAVGLMETGDDVLASCYGAVAASLALEQIGLPALGVGEDRVREERWNGVGVRERLGEYLSRLRISVSGRS
ncbi:pfkB family kinase [Mollisia scopiformis]|uniref:PfkB family kinase n=1 Tax=Mollisia scopiformis TaxID=149040 RepID=A0A194X6Y9_MOLSC|nr:pfkB family kinase [Mollisia scopiformis]KUJ15943.1 pfkB family kinase [Mollisia scopiformis]